MPARRWWARLLAPWWRCQCSEYGARSAEVWDVRVRRQGNGAWRLCHGRVDLGRHPVCSDLRDLLDTLGVPRDRRVRVVLERGSANDRMLFRGWAQACGDSRLAGAAVKSPWEWIVKDTTPSVECYYRPWDSGLGLRGNLRRWLREPRTLLSSIRLTARRAHDDIGSHKADAGTVYWHDRL